MRRVSATARSSALPCGASAQEEHDVAERRAPDPDRHRRGGGDERQEDETEPGARAAVRENHLRRERRGREGANDSRPQRPARFGPLDPALHNAFFTRGRTA